MEEIEFRDLSFSYPGCQTDALKHISLEIHESEFVVVCGKSGCGKSTFLRQMKKSMTPYGRAEGKVLYRGTPVQDLDKKQAAFAVGFVGQNPENQVVTNKVWHELAFGLESLGYPNGVIQKKVAEMASYFGIQTWFRKNVYELSGGQKQILNLASVMVMQPRVLILDEPTSQLDPIMASEFIDTLVKLNRELGTTIILSEHRLEELFPVADRILVMSDGRADIFDSARNVGKYLSGGPNRHEMYYGMPAIMKIYTELRDAEVQEGDCPVTVKEGRRWLSSLLGGQIRCDSMRSLLSKEAGSAGSIPTGKERKHILSRVKKERPLIELEDVWFRYDRHGDDVIRGLSFHVEKGEFLCLLGGNGVGKSTAVRLMAGLLTPYEGKIRIGGDRLKETKCRIGLLPQNPQAVFTEITVEEELYDVLYYTPVSEKEKKQQIEEMLRTLELEHLKKSHPYDLSGGEQQRLALGKILMCRPEILLLDEPTKGLDPFFKKKLAGILSSLKEKGITIVMVTHDIEFSAEFSDRCAMFFDGRIVNMDSPREFFSGNRFYTTASHRVSHEFFRDAVIYQDVVRLCRENMI